MINKIYMIIGPSGSGKDTIYSRLLRDFPFLNPVIQYTTRKKRDNETQGKEYYFVNEEEMDSFDDLIDKREYTVVYNGKPEKVYYGNRLSYFNISGDYVDYICITTLEGLNMFCQHEYLKKKIVCFYLDVDYNIRCDRMKARYINELKGKEADNNYIEEIERRLQQDEIDFSKEKLEEVPIDIHRIDGENTVGIVVTDIKKVIRDLSSPKELMRMTKSIIESKLR